MARKTKVRIRSAEQLRVLGSPATLEVFESLQSGGAATARQLAPRINRKANTLHYHLRKLVRLGLVEAVGSRRSGARTETIYDVTADSFEGPTAPRDPILREATNDVVASLLRLATRDYARASENSESLVQSGKHANIATHRCKGWLPKRVLAEVNAHLDAVRDIFKEHREPGRGELCALTLVLTPLSQDAHPPKGHKRRNVR